MMLPGVDDQWQSLVWAKQSISPGTHRFWSILDGLGVCQMHSVLTDARFQIRHRRSRPGISWSG
jgi:hypothetical protein